jgi:hypothetical protein
MECIGFILLLILLAVLVTSRQAREDRNSPPPIYRYVPPNEPPDGPGRFLVLGVHRESREDVTFECEAASIGNAKAKGELEGILVTKVERRIGLPPAPKATEPKPAPIPQNRRGRKLAGAFLVFAAVAYAVCLLNYNYPHVWSSIKSWLLAHPM